jgi:hypothetical protein
MTRRDKSFRLSKEFKRILTRLDNPLKGEWKKALIDAELSASIPPKSNKKKDRDE